MVVAIREQNTRRFAGKASTRGNGENERGPTEKSFAEDNFLFRLILLRFQSTF